MKVAGFVLVLIVASVPAFAQPEEAGPVLPECVYGVLELADPVGLQDHVAEFVAAIDPDAPMPPLFGIMVGKLVRTFSPGIIDDTYPLRIFLVTGPDAGTGYVVVFASKGAGAYRATLLPALKNPEDRDGMIIYAEEKQTFDMAAFKKATPQEQENKEDFVTVVRKTFVIAEQDNWMLAGTVPEAVAELRDAIGEGVIGQDRLLPGTDDVAFQLNMAVLAGHLSQKEGGMLAGTRAITTLIGLQGDDAQTEFAREILDAELDVAEEFLGQLSSLDASFSLDGQGQRFRGSVVFKDDSVFAEYFNGVTPGVPASLKYIPAAYSNVFAVKLGDMRLLQEAFGEIQSKMADMFAEKGIELNRDVFLASGFNYSGEGVVGLRKGEHFNIVKAGRVRDEALAREAIRLAPEWFKGTLGIMEKAPKVVEMTTETGQYNGHDIVQMSVKFPEGEPAAARTLGQPASMSDVFGAIFGEQFNSSTAVIDGVLLGVSGDDSPAAIRKIIDGDSPSVLDNDRVKLFLQELPEDSTGFAVVNLPDLVQIALDFAGRTMPNMGWLPVKFGEGPGSTATLHAGRNGMGMDVVLPVEEFKVIVDGFKAAFAEAKMKKQAAQLEHKGPEPPPQD
jgi:hypothetical protein